MKDYSRQRFGRLTVRRTYSARDKSGQSRSFCECVCDCGTTVDVRTDSLTSKRTTSCGCASQKNLFRRLDLSGKRFGRIVAIKDTGKLKYHSPVWLCRCDCGTVFETTTSSLYSAKSCGCYARERAIETGTIFLRQELENSVIDHTNIRLIGNGIIKSNTSGVRGVHWDKSRNKWLAQINFKGKHYYLGRFRDIADAEKAYIYAEEQTHGKFLEWYEEYKKNKVEPKLER